MKQVLREGKRRGINMRKRKEKEEKRNRGRDGNNRKHAWRSRKKSQRCKKKIFVYFIYLLTPWCRVLLEKLTGLQQVQNFSAFQVHYRTNKRPPTVSILGQPNPVHIPISHLLDIHLNIIHPSTLRFPQWSLSLPRPYTPPLLTHMCHMPSPSHSSRFYHPHNIGWAVKII